MHESVYSAVVNQNLPLYLNMPLQTLCQTMMTSAQLIRSRQSAHSNGSNPFSHHSNRALSRREPGSTFLSIHLNHILGALSKISIRDCVSAVSVWWAVDRLWQVPHCPAERGLGRREVTVTTTTMTTTTTTTTMKKRK